MSKSPPHHRLFISSECSCCAKMLDYLKTKKIHISITNVDEEYHPLPFSIMVFPALVLGDQLICYGFEDIIKKLKANYTPDKHRA